MFSLLLLLAAACCKKVNNRCILRPVSWKRLPAHIPSKVHPQLTHPPSLSVSCDDRRLSFTLSLPLSLRPSLSTTTTITSADSIPSLPTRRPGFLPFCFSPFASLFLPQFLSHHQSRAARHPYFRARCQPQMVPGDQNSASEASR